MKKKVTKPSPVLPDILSRREKKLSNLSMLGFLALKLFSNILRYNFLRDI
jgi:hypothetical protein